VPAANGAAIPWDAYHVNSVQLTGHGTFLVSMRNTWSAYLVDKSSGAIEWTLSGVPALSNFTLPASGMFAWQHDVELHPGNVVSMFDDSCCAILAGGKTGPPSGPSRGLVLKLNTATHSASFVAQYGPLPAAVTGLPPARFNAAFLGNTQLLANGNVVVGWGSQPFFSEFSRSGKLLLDAHWPAPDLSYRAYVQQWVGEPFYGPSGASRKSRGKTILSASWDGATQVSRWRYLAGSDPSKLSVVATKPISGFETSVTVQGTYKWLRVQAVNAKGQIIGTSKAFGSAGSTNPVGS
jgi:Arylsulfotransferase (ASST)